MPICRICCQECHARTISVNIALIKQLDWMQLCNIVELANHIVGCVICAEMTCIFVTYFSEIVFDIVFNNCIIATAQATGSTHSRPEHRRPWELLEWHDTTPVSCQKYASTLPVLCQQRANTHCLKVSSASASRSTRNNKCSEPRGWKQNAFYFKLILLFGDDWSWHCDTVTGYWFPVAASSDVNSTVTQRSEIDSLWRPRQTLTALWHRDRRLVVCGGLVRR